MLLKKGIVNIHGTDYYTVARRVFDFRSEHPASDEWGIMTEIISIDADRVVMKAYVVSPTGKVVGTGHAEEVRSASKINQTSALENCETSCIGRAVFAATAAGFDGSTQYASADEVVAAVAQQEAPPRNHAPVVAFAAQPDPVAPQPGEVPPCPDCGGPMWDNADKRRQGGKAPAYKCKDSKWDAATKSASGCQGIVWDAVDEGVALRDIIEPDRHEDYEVGSGQPEAMPF